MRRLAQPEVLKSAGIAAAATALLCYPRLALWTTRSLPIWYLEAMLFFGGIVLWAFVFAWHTEYTHHPVFNFKPDPALFAVVTLMGIVAAIGLHRFLDPLVRLRTPGDYPVTAAEWIAMALFNLAFSELFLVFAPFAWLVRLFRNRPTAMLLTVLLGMFVLALRNRSSPIPPPLFAAMLAIRAFLGFLSLFFYVRGGAVLAWWWTLLLQMRYGFDLRGGL